jgi:hypothetical protein
MERRLLAAMCCCLVARLVSGHREHKVSVKSNGSDMFCFWLNVAIFSFVQKNVFVFTACPHFIIRIWKEVAWMVIMMVLDASPSVPTTIFPSSLCQPAQST